MDSLNHYHRQLTDISERMERWAKMGKFKSFVNQDEISQEIVHCHTRLSDCITALQVSSPTLMETKLSETNLENT